METILTDTIKSSMRILSKSAVIEQDINNSIAACKLDLQLAGVVNINENDALIIRAVVVCVRNGFMLARATVHRKHSGNNNTDYRIKRNIPGSCWWISD